MFNEMKRKKIVSIAVMALSFVLIQACTGKVPEHMDFSKLNRCK